MLNPDGVILGNYRTGISGRDLNRVYINPNEIHHPTIFHVKRLIKTLKTTHDIFGYFDFHGHGRKDNVFLYGLPYPEDKRMFYMIRVLPKLLSDISEMFRYSSCSYHLNKGKRETARAVMSNEFGIKQVFTVEASLAGFMRMRGDAGNGDEEEFVAFDAEGFRKIGEAIGVGLRGLIMYSS